MKSILAFYFYLIINWIRWTGTWHPLGSFFCLKPTGFLLPDVALEIIIMKKDEGDMTLYNNNNNNSLISFQNPCYNNTFSKISFFVVNDVNINNALKTSI